MQRTEQCTTQEDAREMPLLWQPEQWRSRMGLNSFFPGIGGTVVADASGVACVASGATIAITLDGVVTIVDGAVYYI